MELVADIERTNNAWAVGRFDLLASQAKLPGRHRAPDSARQVVRRRRHINGGVSAQLRAEANDDQAAENLRGVVNGVISLARLQGQNDPKLTSLIQSLQMSGSGKTVQLSFTRPGRDLRADGSRRCRSSLTLEPPRFGEPPDSRRTSGRLHQPAVCLLRVRAACLSRSRPTVYSSPTVHVADLVFFYGTLMAGFDRRRRAGIDEQADLHRARRDPRGAVRPRACIRRRCRRRTAHVWGEVYEMAEPEAVLAALDEIEGLPRGQSRQQPVPAAARPTCGCPTAPWRRRACTSTMRRSAARRASLRRLSRARERRDDPQRTGTVTRQRGSVTGASGVTAGTGGESDAHDRRHRQAREGTGAPTAQLEGAVMVFQPMTVVDISHNGAQIETPFPLQLDSLHEFRLSLGERFGHRQGPDRPLLRRRAAQRHHRLPLGHRVRRAVGAGSARDRHFVDPAADASRHASTPR